MLIHKFPLTYPQLKIFFCTQFALTFPITLILYLQRNPADCYIFFVTSNVFTKKSWRKPWTAGI